MYSYALTQLFILYIFINNKGTHASYLLVVCSIHKYVEVDIFKKL
jgi:hypothetical protein